MTPLKVTYDEIYNILKEKFYEYEVEKTYGTWNKILIKKDNSNLYVYTYTKSDTDACIWYFNFYSIWLSRIETMICENVEFIDHYKDLFEKTQITQDHLKSVTNSIKCIDENEIRNWRINKLLK